MRRQAVESLLRRGAFLSDRPSPIARFGSLSLCRHLLGRLLIARVSHSQKVQGAQVLDHVQHPVQATSVRASGTQQPELTFYHVDDDLDVEGARHPVCDGDESICPSPAAQVFQGVQYDQQAHAGAQIIEQGEDFLHRASSACCLSRALDQKSQPRRDRMGIEGLHGLTKALRSQARRAERAAVLCRDRQTEHLASTGHQPFKHLLEGAHGRLGGPGVDGSRRLCPELLRG
jgi:hypothetical protein